MNHLMNSASCYAPETRRKSRGGYRIIQKGGLRPAIRKAGGGGGGGGGGCCPL